MFGLMTTSTFSAYKSLSNRRRIFYQYPQGAAPLMGLLSLMEADETDKSEFGWYEDRLANQRTETAAIAAGVSGPFSASGSDVASTVAGFNIAEDDVIRVRVDDTSKFKENHVLWIKKAPTTTAGVYAEIKGVVTSIISATKVEIRVLKSHANVLNNSGTSVDLAVVVIGNANPEGARSGQGIWTPPKNPTNYTQIFRTAFSFTRTALKSGVTFDQTGIYKAKAKQNSLRHMIELEKAFLFGEKQEYIATVDGEDLPQRNTGGVLWFLEQWEAGTLYGNDPATTNADENKRIIDINGTLSEADYNGYMSRLFENTNNQEYAKLCLCGSTYLNAVNSLFKNQVQLNTNMSSDSEFKFMVHVHETLQGTVYYKTHPLFNQDPDLKGSALYLDVPNLKYRPLNDSDTVLLKNRQENDQDRRKDEWITEAGLELRFPESHMFIERVTGPNLA